MIAALAVFRAVWGFLRSPVGSALACVLIVAAMCALSRQDGLKTGELAERARWEARLAASAKNARATEARNADASQRVGKSVTVKTAEVRTRTEYLTREVIRYVPIDPTRGSLPVGFVRVHDAAATGLPIAPDGAGRADASPSGVDDVALAETLVGNYGTCHVWEEQLIGWQTWARETGLVR